MSSKGELLTEVRQRGTYHVNLSLSYDRSARGHGFARGVRPRAKPNLGPRLHEDFLSGKALLNKRIQICFYETRSSGLRHHNCLVRGRAQFKWLRAATRLRSEHNVCVSHGANIKTLAEGVVYGRVASEHKGPEMFNHGYTQWAANGSPAQLEEFIPRSWQAHGFVMLGVCMCMRPPRRHARASRNASTPARDCAAPCTS